MTPMQKQMRGAIACVTLAARARRFDDPRGAALCARAAHVVLTWPATRRPAPDPETGPSRASGDWPAGWWLMLVPLGLALWALMLWGIARLVAS